MSLKASRTLSRIDDICRFLSGVDDDFVVLTGARVLDDILDSVLDDVLDGLHMPQGSYAKIC